MRPEERLVPTIVSGSGIGIGRLPKIKVKREKYDYIPGRYCPGFFFENIEKYHALVSCVIASLQRGKAIFTKAGEEMIRIPRINKGDTQKFQQAGLPTGQAGLPTGQAGCLKQKLVFIRMALVSNNPRVIRIVRIEKEVG